jgi:hypothetical protein
VCLMCVCLCARARDVPSLPLHARAEQEWLRVSLATGKRFKLAIFPTASVDCQLATWSGVEHLMRSVYPEVWESKIERHFATIRHTPISEIEAQAGYDMEQVGMQRERRREGERERARASTREKGRASERVENNSDFAREHMHARDSTEH